MTLSCPRCTQPVRVEHHHLKKSGTAQLDTMGHVEIASGSEVAGDIVCAKFINGGFFKGDAQVYGTIDLTVGSSTQGTLLGRSLRVVRGANVRLTVDIRPDFRPPENAMSRPGIANLDRERIFANQLRPTIVMKTPPRLSRTSASHSASGRVG